MSVQSLLSLWRNGAASFPDLSENKLRHCCGSRKILVTSSEPYGGLFSSQLLSCSQALRATLSRSECSEIV